MPFAAFDVDVQEEPAAGIIRMTFLSASLSGFARWFMLFGDQAEVLKPQQLKTEIRSIAESILQNLK